ncbi:N-acetyltransferase [Noviherbaspirillum cavernae]|uniref:N-acetyltransferase n=1 Tax=Noviherbaspirillum cavernae TaxID=2320862 RepID=A0A418X719_9BURK|nr:N-acetyltransferase [Noviherbaspirillum cavernae]
MTNRLIEFNTERLRLRPWRMSDRAPFAALNADSRVMEYFPGTLDGNTSDALAERIGTQLAQRGWGLWAVEIPQACPFIGFVGLSVPADDIPLAPCVEIGWRLAHAHWGKGYASEAARGALRVGFEMLGLAEIVSFTALRNTRSRAVMERIGMQCRDEYFEHPRLPEGHPLRLHVVYRISRATWSCD